MVSYVQSNRGNWREQLGAKSKAKHNSNELLIEIEAFEQSYHITDHHAEIGRVDDEAIIDLSGMIVRSSDRKRQLAGQPAQVSLVCAQSYHTHPEREQPDVPMLMTASLVKEIFQIMAYLPPKPFWALPEAITTGRVTHVLADYQVGRGRDSTLHALYFASHKNIEKLTMACPSSEHLAQVVA